MVPGKLENEEIKGEEKTTVNTKVSGDSCSEDISPRAADAKNCANPTTMGDSNPKSKEPDVSESENNPVTSIPSPINPRHTPSKPKHISKQSKQNPTKLEHGPPDPISTKIHIHSSAKPKYKELKEAQRDASSPKETLPPIKKTVSKVTPASKSQSPSFAEEHGLKEDTAQRDDPMKSSQTDPITLPDKPLNSRVATKVWPEILNQSLTDIYDQKLNTTILFDDQNGTGDVPDQKLNTIDLFDNRNKTEIVNSTVLFDNLDQTKYAKGDGEDVHQTSEPGEKSLQNSVKTLQNGSIQSEHTISPTKQHKGKRRPSKLAEIAEVEEEAVDTSSPKIKNDGKRTQMKSAGEELGLGNSNPNVENGDRGSEVVVEELEEQNRLVGQPTTPTQLAEKTSISRDEPTSQSRTSSTSQNGESKYRDVPQPKKRVSVSFKKDPPFKQLSLKFGQGKETSESKETFSGPGESRPFNYNRKSEGVGLHSSRTSVSKRIHENFEDWIGDERAIRSKAFRNSHRHGVKSCFVEFNAGECNVSVYEKRAIAKAKSQDTVPKALASVLLSRNYSYLVHPSKPTFENNDLPTDQTVEVWYDSSAKESSQTDQTRKNWKRIYLCITNKEKFERMMIGMATYTCVYEPS